jgi:galactoside O-acetyltransferase
MISKIKKLLFQIYISLLSSIPTELGKRLRYIAYKPLFKKVNGRFSIDTGVTIMGFENIVLGNNVSFMKNSYIYAHEGGN